MDAAPSKPSPVPGPSDARTRSLVRALLVVVGVLVLLWAAHEVALVLLLGFSAIVVATALSAPVTWLEQRRVPRVVGTLGILAAALAIGVLAALAVGARLLDETASLTEHAPAYAQDVRDRIDDALGSHPRLGDAIGASASGASTTDAVGAALRRGVTQVGRASLGAVTALVVLVTWVTMVAYLAIEPRSLLRGLLRDG